ncbi:MAG: metallophosphoesterase family protein [Planctomycetes bacterium]|nr:metallophosphoesterase family protein [Planctomycetota bacterium]
MKTLILSDFHLGHEASRLPRMLPGLARVAGGYEQVVVNGDAVNALEGAEDRAAAEPLLRCLNEALAGRGGAPVLITGNHDPIVSAVHYLYCEESRLLVFHGDYVADNPAPWLRKGVEFADAFRRTLEAQGTAPDFAARAELFRQLQSALQIERYALQACRSRLRYVFRQFIPPTRPFTILRYVLSAPGRAAELAAGIGQPVRRVAFGHTHRAGRWTRRGLDVFNTGSYMPCSEPYAVEVEGGEVRMVPVRTLLERKSAAVNIPATLAPSGSPAGAERL